jgi:uncharacterized repeat protein (TIGR01451 family)
MQHLFATGMRASRAWLAAVAAFIVLLGAPMLARAQGCIDHACVTVGSNLVNVDTTQSELLDSLLTSLLGEGTQVDVSVGNYNELLNGSIGLVDLLNELQVDLGLQSPGEVLTTGITLGELLQAAISVAEQNGDLALALALNDLLLDIDGLTQEIQVGDLLDLQLGVESLTNVELNVLDVVVGSIQLFNFTHVDGPTAAVILPGVVLAGLGLDGEIGQVSLVARVLEPPTFVCGPEGATFNTAPVRVILDVTVLDLALDTTGLESGLLGVLGDLLDLLGSLVNVQLDANAAIGQLSLLVEVARGEGVIQTIDAVGNAVTVQATPGVASLYLGQVDPNLAFDRTHSLSPANLDFADIATLDLSIHFSGMLGGLFSDVDVANVAIGAKAFAQGSSEASSFQFTGPYPQTHEFVADGSAVDGLITSLLDNLEIRADVALLQGALGGLLSGLDLNTFISELLTGLLAILQNPTDGLLAGLLDSTLAELLNPLLDSLGIRPGEMGVTVTGLLELCPDLTISKSHLGNFTVGANANYILNVRNVGQAPTAHPVTVIDTLPGEFSFVSASGVGWSVVAQTGQTVVLQNSQTLAPNNSLPLLTLTVNANAAGSVVNTASVTVTGDSNAANNIATDPTVINPAAGGGAPDLSISKSHSGDFTAGNLHNYTIQVQNAGTGVTTGAITVVDTLPTGMTYVSHSGAGWQLLSTAGQVVTLQSTGVLAPAAALPPLGLTVFIDEAAVGTVVNTVTVTTAGDTNLANDTATDPTVVNSGGGAGPDLTVAKTHSGGFTAGNLHSYVLTVANVGAGATSGAITVVDTLPVGMAYFSHSGSGWQLISIAGQQVTLQHAGPVAANSGLPLLTLNVTVGAQAVGTVTNTATVSTAGDTNTANNTAADPTVVQAGADGPSPDLAISKSHSGNFTQGAVHSYTIVVQNVGDGPTTAAIKVADTLPAGMSYVSHSGSGWSLVDLAGHTVTFEHQATVAPNGALPNLLLNVIASSSGVFTNTAAVSTTGDTNVANNLAFDATLVHFDGSGDDDNDGIPNQDECPNFPNCPDTDGDGTPDYLDPDDDGDGIPTAHECPNFPNCPDTDGDGTPDYLDPDDDGDGVWTKYECPNFPNCPDTDGDGTPDFLDRDDDGDGVWTKFENPDPNGDGNPDDAQDTDGDGTPDYLDPDDDGDGKPTITENADPNGDGNPDDALDTDGDGIPDYLDPDDGVAGGPMQIQQMIPLVMNG